jgi:hypothetical protein
MPAGYNMSWFCFHSLPPIPGGCPQCKADPQPRCGCADCQAMRSRTASTASNIERPARPAGYSASKGAPPPLPLKRPSLGGDELASAAAAAAVASANVGASDTLPARGAAPPLPRPPPPASGATGTPAKEGPPRPLPPPKTESPLAAAATAAKPPPAPRPAPPALAPKPGDLSVKEEAAKSGADAAPKPAPLPKPKPPVPVKVSNDTGILLTRRVLKHSSFSLLFCSHAALSVCLCRQRHRGRCSRASPASRRAACCERAARSLARPRPDAYALAGTCPEPIACPGSAAAAAQGDAGISSRAGPGSPGAPLGSTASPPTAIECRGGCSWRRPACT